MIAHKNYKPPTKRERERFEQLKSMGCVVCWLSFGVRVWCEIHHIVRGNKRLGHWYTIPLCSAHHRIPGEGLMTSIANGRKAFARVHGSELDLWVKTQHILGLDDSVPASKVLPRRVA